ncbi:MAG: hypothetical protein K2W96_08985, partial [Gemmataceae bacterium]|nr:hypothetical protein [Gemmataceae bacterium]
HITLRVPGVGRAWAGAKTKDAAALVVRFVGKRGQFNLARLEGLGATATLDERKDHTVMELSFLHPPAGDEATKLRRVLEEHLRGFRESFAGSAAEDEEAALAGC